MPVSSRLLSGHMINPSKRIIWVLRVLSSVALCISIYLAWVAYNSTGVAGCGGGIFDCDHVLNSRWSKWFQIPVGAAAALLYLAVISALSFCGTKTTDRRQAYAWRGLTVCGVAAGLAALWFIGLQIFVIGNYCSYCLLAHTCGLTIAGIILWKRPLGGRATATMSAISIVCVLGLIGGQMMTPEPQSWEAEYHVVETPAMPGNSYESPDSTETAVFESPSLDSEDVFAAPSIDD